METGWQTSSMYAQPHEYMHLWRLLTNECTHLSHIQPAGLQLMNINIASMMQRVLTLRYYSKFCNCWCQIFSRGNVIPDLRLYHLPLSVTMTVQENLGEEKNTRFPHRSAVVEPWRLPKLRKQTERNWEKMVIRHHQIPVCLFSRGRSRSEHIKYFFGALTGLLK